MNRPRTTYGFTLIELLVVISIIALLIGILLPALGAARRTARQMQNNTQVRGIHQAMVMYSQSNKTYFPGLLSSGNGFVAAADITDGTSGTTGNGSEVEPRFAILLDGNYFTGEYAISPAETKTEWTTGGVQTVNYSYAMHEINGDGTTALSTGGASREVMREEWRDTLNTEAAIVSDRLFDGTFNNPTTYTSIWTSDSPGDWRGTVAWNDNHVEFSTTAILETAKYGKVRTEDDRLFDRTEAPHVTLPTGVTSQDANAMLVTRAHNGAKQ